MQLNWNSTNIICKYIPPYVNSKGLWVEFDDPQWWLNSSLPLLEFQLVLFYFSFVITYLILKRFGVSKISSQIIVGLAFGLSWNQWEEAKLKHLDVGSQEVLVLLADFGYTLYLFLSAVKVDVTMTIRTGRSALVIGMSALLVPLITEAFIEKRLFEESQLTNEQKICLPILMIFHGMTSFPVVASLVNELRITNSELGRLCLFSALVSDIFGNFILVTGGQNIRYNLNPSRATAEVGALIMLILLSVFVFRPAMHWIIKQTPQGMPVKKSYLQLVVWLAFLTTVMGNFTGQASIVGPYILGLAIPDGPPLASTLADRIECLVFDVFMPIFITTCALRADLSKISAASFDVIFTKLNIILICVAFSVKFLACVFSSMYCKLPFKDAFTLSLIMSCKGSVELVSYTTARDFRTIDSELFGCCIISIWIFATMVPIAVRRLYDPSRKYAGYRNRNIMHLNPSSDELRLLACIHRKENVNAIIHLLNLSCPTTNNPISVYIFHLIELLGRTAPIFISHKRQNNPFDSQSYSLHIIQSFDQFERENEGAVYTECFTTISPCKVMYDDICTIALDMDTSFIILPFHRTWTLEGLVDGDDNKIRTLNKSVLERAPCSVGIFADRGSLGRIRSRTSVSSSRMKCKYSVCVIFLGGKDDREAMSYAKRMVSDLRVELTILRLRATEEDQSRSKLEDIEEDIVDGEVIEEFRNMCLGDERVVYIEEVCGDGQETSSKLRERVVMFDLVVVGRRYRLESSQTAGLNAWSEFPELGLLGDLIASNDIRTSASLLVIQQQQII